MEEEERGACPSLARGVPAEFKEWDLEEFTMCEPEILESMDFCGFTFAPLSAAAQKGEFQLCLLLSFLCESC